MLKGLWEGVQLAEDSERSVLLHEGVLNATRCLVALSERLNFDSKDIEQAVKMLDAAKRGLGFVNKLPAGTEKVKHAQRVMGNLNKIRGFVNRLVQNQVDAENEELESFDVDDYFTNLGAYSDDVGQSMPSAMVGSSNQDDYDLPINGVGEVEYENEENSDYEPDHYGDSEPEYDGNPEYEPDHYENEEFAPKDYEPDYEVEYGDSEPEYDSFGDIDDGQWAEKDITKPSHSNGVVDGRVKPGGDRAFKMGSDGVEGTDGDYPEDFAQDDMMMKGDRDYGSDIDDSYENDLARDEGGSMSTDYSDYDKDDVSMENEESSDFAGLEYDRSSQTVFGHGYDGYLTGQDGDSIPSKFDFEYDLATGQFVNFDDGSQDGGRWAEVDDMEMGEVEHNIKAFVKSQRLSMTGEGFTSYLSNALLSE